MSEQNCASLERKLRLTKQQEETATRSLSLANDNMARLRSLLSEASEDRNFHHVVAERDALRSEVAILQSKYLQITVTGFCSAVIRV